MDNEFYEGYVRKLSKVWYWGFVCGNITGFFITILAGVIVAWLYGDPGY